MRYLTVNEVLDIYPDVIRQSEGLLGIRDLGTLELATARPQMTFGGEELYAMIVEKATALDFSLIQNHPFVDGNKRSGHAAMEIFLVLNKYEISANMDEQLGIILQVASGQLKRQGLTEW